MKHVIIIGGGIAGLTAAHELVEQNYKVTLIERNSIVGGLARTFQDSSKKICPYEYSWRAYGEWYQNVYDIMKRIPFSDKETVFDKLVILQGGEKTCSKKIPEYSDGKPLSAFNNTFSQLPLKDYFVILPILIKYWCSCDERNRNTFSKIGLRDYIHRNKLSAEAENLLGKIVGPYLGFDYHNASLYDLLYCGEMMSNNSDKNYNFNITSLPTNYAWFEPWIRLLKSKGVSILVQTELIKINLNNIDNKIDNIIVTDKSKFYPNYQMMDADYYVNCTGPEVLKKILEPYKLYKSVQPFYNDIYNVAKNGRQIQLSVYYYIDKKIFLENKNTLAYLPNTPWLLMVLSTGHIWGDEYMSQYCDKNIKEIISVGICEPYVNGVFIKKPWSKCTRDETKIEAWHQLINDADFKNNICIENNTELNNINIIQFTMWDSFIYKNGKMDTYEPKWANNINTIQYRPGPATSITNLFVGGSYSNTSTGTYSMESAAESGKIVAKHICKIDTKNDNIYLHTKERYMITYPIRYIDKLIHNGNFIYIIIIVLIIVFIFWSLCIKKLYKFSSNNYIRQVLYKFIRI